MSKASIGVQTASPEQPLPEVSHREDKMDDQQIAAMTEEDMAELELWAREKVGIESYSAFYIEQLEPFMRNL